MDRIKKDIQSAIQNRYLFESLRDKTIFITGATGLIGSMLIKTLLSANQKYNLNLRIIGLIRNYEKAKVVFGDEYKDIEFTINIDAACDFIIHTVSPTASSFFINKPVETIKTSVLRTMEALELAKKNKASMVYLSSMEQYGVPYCEGEKMTEDKIGIINHLNIRSSYSESKRICECLCASYAAEYGVDVKIARVSQTFGAGILLDDNRMPMQFAKAVVRNENIILHTEGKSLSNFVYLTDAILGIITILNKGIPGEAYNVCNDKETRSVREIAEIICSKVANGTIKVCVDIPQKNMGYAPDVNMYVISDKLRNLGWEATVSMEEGYRRLVDYVRETIYEK